MILKSAENKTLFVKDMLFTKNARAAWEHVLFSFKKLNPMSCVLMPSYIGHTDREGSGVFDPVKSQNVAAEFYKLNEDLTIDREDFLRLLKTRKFSCVLVIHYFGFCRNNMFEISALCHENNALLIEDCAHAFQLYRREPSVGNYCDFSFYSLHKYLSTKAGGILVNHSKVVTLAPLLDSNKMSYDDLEHFAKSDLEAISEKRRLNYVTYYNLIKNNSHITVLYHLLESDIPQSFPIRIKNGDREGLYFFLMERGAPTTALYYRMIAEIQSREFPISHEIASDILNLPVHQDTEREDIQIICDLISDFFS
ncbi:DegT/DnrJ/EryC1/StrS family aminotransferase [Pedobacter sp. JCM 36344]|uniref:DegT/DnrJ/EryC1/StrS family aminotransferase n=1 Tax=Pedobacter sp. JCM 36344 TaxID=3374280 RepID=UPI00397B91EE